MEADWGKIWKKVRRVLVVAGLGLGALFFWQWVRFYDGKLHLIFCDVGQGDAILIRKGTDEFLIDGGPDKKVLSCLSDNMPFWDKEIEVMVLTHPQADHLTGLFSVLERYGVGYFLSSPAGNLSAGYQKLKDLIKEKGVLVKNLYSGGKVSLAGLELFSLWPQKEWLTNNFSQEELAKNIYGGAILGAQTTTNLNDFSLVFHLKYGLFDALLTGDAGEQVQDKIAAAASVPEVEVFKVPHHGSKTAFRENFLEKVSPKLAVISVGKNQWGHPAKEVIEKLTHFHQNATFAGAKSRNLEIKILRTDQDGEVEIVTDGKSWQVK